MPLTEGTPPRGTRFADMVARLADLPNYAWDADIKPFHSVRPAAAVSISPSS